ncbi:MAG: MFS transporter [Knoellia sp.]
MGARATRSRLGSAAAAFTSNARNPDLRRAQLSFLAAWTAEWAFTVALGIVAYRDGGAVAVGLVGLLRMVPAAVLAPLLSPIADRGRRERVLVVVSVVRGAATGGAALVAALSGPPSVIYGFAVLSTIAATLYRPAHSALLPSLCHTGFELASANVVRGMLDSIATLVGPLVAAVLLGVADVDVVLAVAAAASFVAAALVWRLDYDVPPRPPAPKRPNLALEAVEGARAVRRDPGLALIVGLGAAQSFTRGALTVLSVVMALELLHTGESGVGVLMTSVGVGAVLGSLAASLLVGSRRLGRWFGTGVALWGVPLAIVGLIPLDVVAFCLLAFIGVGNALVDVGGFTLVARLAPDHVLGRVFGVLESLTTVSVGFGALTASLVGQWFGARTALITIGLLCPVLAVLSWRRLRRIDEAVDVLEGDSELLRRVPMFGSLTLPAVEQLARGLELLTVPAHETVFRQGEVGDCYFLIESGEVAVVGDGAVVATLGPGEGFGEIALLRSGPRTATVRALTELRLRALDGDRFVCAVLGYAPSASAASATVDGLLEHYAPGERPDPSVE